MHIWRFPKIWGYSQSSSIWIGVSMTSTSEKASFATVAWEFQRGNHRTMGVNTMGDSTKNNWDLTTNNWDLTMNKLHLTMNNSDWARKFIDSIRNKMGSQNQRPMKPQMQSMFSTKYPILSGAQFWTHPEIYEISNGTCPRKRGIYPGTNKWNFNSENVDLIQRIGLDHKIMNILPYVAINKLDLPPNKNTQKTCGLKLTQ